MKNPGNYSLLSFKLTPYNGERAIDIAGLIPYVEITESVTNDSLRGMVSVIDNAGVLENLPIRCEERATVTFEDSLENKQTYEFFIYKVDNIAVAENNQGVSYNLYFTSIQRWEAGKKKVIAAYDRPPSEIAQDLFSKFYAIRGGDGKAVEGLNKDLIVEEMKEDIRITIPNVSPMRAMNFVAERSYSLDSPSCSFRFFETPAAFYFMSDEQILKQARESDNVFSFTNYHIERSPATFHAQMNNLENLTVTRKINSAEEQIDGSYKSRVHIMDLNYGIYKQLDYDYEEKKKLYHGTADFKERHTKEFLANDFTQGPAKEFYILQNYDETSYGSVASNQFYPEIVTNRTGFRKQMNSLTVSASGPGRLDITCGAIVNLLVQEYSSLDMPKLNKQLSGEYVVYSVNKIFDKDTMTNEYILVKRGWTEE